MRFVLGVVIGFGVGFAGAILFAPDKPKKNDWPPRFPEAPKIDGGANGTDASKVRSVLASVKERVNEALSEAKDARKQAEREMLQRYRRSVGREED